MLFCGRRGVERVAGREPVRREREVGRRRSPRARASPDRASAPSGSASSVPSEDDVVQARQPGARVAVGRDDVVDRADDVVRERSSRTGSHPMRRRRHARPRCRRPAAPSRRPRSAQRACRAPSGRQSSPCVPYIATSRCLLTMKSDFVVVGSEVGSVPWFAAETVERAAPGSSPERGGGGVCFTRSTYGARCSSRRCTR